MSIKCKNLITLNVRKNPYSKDGRALAKAWWNINVTWPWIEDFEPYSFTGKYIDYTTLDGGFANPTLILIDKEGKVAGLYHVYQLGKGEIGGMKSAETLYGDLLSLGRGEASGFKEITSSKGVNYLGMFALGIVTSLPPCSVALLLAMFSYVMTARRKEEARLSSRCVPVSLLAGSISMPFPVTVRLTKKASWSGYI